MTAKFLYFIFMSWAGIALVSQIGDFIAPTADSADLNQVASGQVIHIDEAQFNGNVLNAAIGAWNFGTEFIGAFFRMATFDTPFWSGDMQVIRYFLLATLGLAALSVVGWELFRLVRG